MKPKQTLTIVLAVLLLLGMLAGCGGQSASYDAISQEAASWDSLTSNGAAYEPQADSSALANRKLIRTIDINAETEDMDTLLSHIDAQVAQLGGYMQTRTVYSGSTYSASRSRYADLTIRIPVDRLDAFVTQVSGAANVTSSTEETEDVTLSYIATESRITALETEQTRLLELLSQAETMDDLLTIESRLTDVRTELESVTSQLRLYDNLVDYGTVNLYIREVVEYTVVEEKSPFQRMGEGFLKSLKGLGSGIVELTVFLVAKLPYLATAAVVIAVVVLIVKHRRKKSHSPADPPENPPKP